MRAFRWLAPLAGLLLLSIPFYRVLYFTDRALLFRDLSRDFLAQKSIWAAAMRAGEGIPFWNLFAFGGTPFYSMLVGGPLHPLNPVLLLFPQAEMARALSIFVWLNYVLIYCGAFLLLRSYRCGSWLAALMAATLTLSGYLLSAHNLCHVVAASAAAPWFLFFAGRFLAHERFGWLLLASLALAWPVYAGEPQFTYVLAFLSAFLFLRKKKVLAWLQLGALSVMAAAALLLPAAFDILKSERLALDTTELLFFSFHPVRLAELFFPYFLGNHYGADTYFGGQYVNFAYKHPFIFSVYPGVLSVLGFLLLPAFLFRGRFRIRKNNPRAWLLTAGVALGLVAGVGTFSPVPLYEWMARLVPFFGMFRYPERLLFWPMFAFWLLASLHLRALSRKPSLMRSPGFFALPLLLIAASAALLAFGDLRATGISAVQETLAKFLGLLVVLGVVARLRNPKIPFLCACTAVVVLELCTNQHRLVWDQSKHIADLERYRLPKAILADMRARQAEIAKGAPFRFASENFSRFDYISSQMDHTTSTTFNAFENLVPNTASIFGIEDVSGYFSYSAADRVKFLKATVGPERGQGLDLRFYFDLMGAHYVPERDEAQQIVLRRNETALPYLYVPDKVFLDATFEGSLKTLRAGAFRPNRDAVLAGAAGPVVEQSGERGNFRILRRDGRGIDFEYHPGPGKAERYLVVSESFHEGWRAWAGGKALPLWTANGWSMITRLDGVQPGRAITLSFRFEPPWLRPGLALTLAWWLLAGAAALRWWANTRRRTWLPRSGRP